MEIKSNNPNVNNDNEHEHDINLEAIALSFCFRSLLTLRRDILKKRCVELGVLAYSRANEERYQSEAWPAEFFPWNYSIGSFFEYDGKVFMSIGDVSKLA